MHQVYVKYIKAASCLIGTDNMDFIISDSNLFSSTQTLPQHVEFGMEKICSFCDNHPRDSFNRFVDGVSIGLLISIYFIVQNDFRADGSESNFID